MPDNDAILKRLKHAEAELGTAHEAAEMTIKIIENSQRTVARAKKDVQLPDTARKTAPKRRAGKKRFPATVPTA
ncbi:MAG: hypothetical protein JWL71_3983 [Acidobacteria bacterium]|nr:hypothetical protein [Acidobacteriota bacterium]